MLTSINEMSAGIAVALIAVVVSGAAAAADVAVVYANTYIHNQTTMDEKCK